jgi:hypothetical protein
MRSPKISGVCVSGQASPNSEPSWWFKWMMRFEGPLSVLMFGVGFLGLGSLLLVVWCLLLVGAASVRNWEAFAEFLLGTPFVIGVPLIGLKWLKQRRAGHSD